MKAEEAPLPPDGGWGWVVVASSFLIHFCIDGITYAFGVLAAEFVEDLGCSRQLNGWIVSVMVGLTLGGGPVASVASSKLGHRCVTIIGAVVSSCGYVASFFVTEAWVLIITAGVIVGFGMSLIYLPAIVCVGMYFDARRSTAIGIAVCGSGFGTFVFSPMISLLIQKYTWRGAVLILGGMVLQCAVFGALFRPLDFDAQERQERARQELQLLQQRRDHEAGDSTPRSGASAPDALHCGASARERVHSSASAKEHRQVGVRPRSHSGSALKERQQLGSDVSLTHVMWPAHYLRSNRSIAAAVEEAPSERPATLRSAIHDELEALFSLSLMRNPAFVLFLLSNLLCSIGFNAPFLYVPDRAQRHGVSRTKSSLLVSLIGIANMIGRFVFGFLSDRKWVNRLQLYNSALVIAGLALVFSFLSYQYAFMAAYCTVFGVFIGTYVTLTSPVLVDLLGLDQLSNSFGMTLMFQGIGVVLGPPIAGFIFDSTSSFDIPFVVCGTCVVLSGLMLFPLPCISKATGFTEARNRAGTLQL